VSTTSKTAAARGVITNAPTVAGNLPQGWIPASSISEASWISLPRPRERCRLSGLSRTTLCEMLARGDIQGITVRRPGAVRGKRLIFKQSLADFLKGLAEQRLTSPTRANAEGKMEGAGQ
jgi:hypothetical protein